jgi:signal transduction histidine kinase
MRKRMESIAGRIELESLPGSGTCVKLMIAMDTWPLRKTLCKPLPFRPRIR